MFVYLIQGILYGLAAAVQPGPFQTYIITQALDRGWRHTLPTAFAPLISDGPIIVMVVLVLNHIPDWLQRSLYITSGLFILYLAGNAFIGWCKFDTKFVPKTQSRRQSLFKAAIMNVLSPGPYIYWSLVTGPVLLAGWHEAPAKSICFLVGFYIAISASLGSIIILFATTRHLGSKVNRTLLGISSVTLVCFGLYQLWFGMFSKSKIFIR